MDPVRVRFEEWSLRKELQKPPPLITSPSPPDAPSGWPLCEAFCVCRGPPQKAESGALFF
jgi:hypothetical protein